MGNLRPNPQPRKRALKPRAPVSFAAIFVSQLTCQGVLGIDERRYLNVLVKACADDVVRVGRLRLVPVDVAIGALRSMPKDDITSTVETDDEPQPDSADAVLAAIGKERAS